MRATVERETSASTDPTLARDLCKAVARAQPSSEQPLAIDSGPRDPAAVLARITKGVKRVDATSFVVTRDAVDAILENQDVVSGSARIVPVMGDGGKASGMRLYGVRPDSLHALLGFENGDQIQKVNGFDMGDPSKALEMYTSMRGATKITVEGVRAGAPLVLRYTIEDGR